MTAHRRLLMVCPDFEPSYRGMPYSLWAKGPKSVTPLLGQLIIAPFTPPTYEISLVELNAGRTGEAVESCHCYRFAADFVRRRIPEALSGDGVRQIQPRPTADVLNNSEKPLSF
jgi:hypothetical protein